MVLYYKFKNIEVDGILLSRPLIPIILRGEKGGIMVSGVLDSGSDITIIPEGIAKGIGLKIDGEESELKGYFETQKAIHGKVNITFVGKEPRLNERLSNVPILILKSSGEKEEDKDVILGTRAVFDMFDITFKKHKNKIILKKNEQKALSC